MGSMRCIRPEVVEVFARTHDDSMLQCLSEVLQVQLTSVDEETQDTVTLPASLGGLGSALRTRVSAYWASWADCMAMIQERHPGIAGLLVRQLDNHPHTPKFASSLFAQRGS